jgi:hypothetical protein
MPGLTIQFPNQFLNGVELFDVILFFRPVSFGRGAYFL